MTEVIDYKRLTEKLQKLKVRFTQTPTKKTEPTNSDLKNEASKQLRRLVEIKKVHQIQIENFSKEQDSFFIKEILVPYLSSVYFGLIKRQNKDYLGITKMKHYINMPELIGDRIVKQINANGDERIDHDEFVPFFLKLLMGSLE